MSFDRIDRQFTSKDSVHLNLTYSRSWFQTPNTYDTLNVNNVVAGGTGSSPVLGDVGDADQKSKIETFNISPTYTRTIGANAVFNFCALCTKGLLQLLSKHKPAGGSGSHSESKHLAGSHSAECWRAHRPLLCAGQKQYQGWCGVRAHFLAGARQSWSHQLHVQQSLRGLYWQAATRFH